MKGYKDLEMQSPTIDKTIKQRLFKAVVSYFEHESFKLRRMLPGAQAEEVCRILLYGEDDVSEVMQSWQVAEQTALDEYRSDSLEIIDYLHLISTELRKRLGQYATPPDIVRYIFRSIKYSSTTDILSKKLIDPACGSGAFLTEAVRIYLTRLKKAKIPMQEWYPMVLSSIYGIDIDVTACFFTRINLAMLLAPSVLEFISKNGVARLKPLSVYCADTLQLFASGEEAGSLFHNGRNRSLKKHFDFVVGNPPYFKIKNLSEALKSAFAESIYGHPNAYGVFLHAGIEMTRAGGRLGFIVPRSMLSGLYFKNLRTFIEKNSLMREIVYLSDRKNVFDNVLHGTMILSLERTVQTDNKISVSFVKSHKDMSNNLTTINVSPNNVVRRLNGSTVWFVANSQRTYDIIGRIVKQHPLLSGNRVNCPAKTGQIVWNRVSGLLASKPGINTLPLVWATDVSKFGFSFNRMGAVRPCNLKITPKTENLIAKGASILLQRVTADEQPSRIVASIPAEFCMKETKGYFVENHLNIIQSGDSGLGLDLFFLLGILNSDIVEFFFRTMNGNTQVSATELNLLPIPVGKYEREIGDIARLIQKASKIKKSDLVADLNTKVALAYGLERADLTFVGRFLSDRRKNDN